MSTPAPAPALRVGFAGTPEFAAVALQAIADAGFTVPLVLSQPDRPAGRGMKLTASPVKQLGLGLGAAIAQPQGLRLDGKYAEDAAAARAAIEAAALDVLVVAAYGLILPAWVLQAPRLGCLNIHGSLLPRWRGAAPIHRAIEAGDAQTGITIMQMDEGLDTGDMLLVAAEPIRGDDSTGVLHDRLAALGGRLVVQALHDAAAGRLQRTVQPEAGVTYAHKIAKAEGLIDWSQPAAVIERRVRAFDPFPGASLQLGEAAHKVWRARVVDAPAAASAAAPAPGQVLSVAGGLPVIACGQGTALALIDMQRPGGKRQPASAWLQAQPLAMGQTLG